jgi:hypothetical protein
MWPCLVMRQTLPRSKARSARRRVSSLRLLHAHAAPSSNTTSMHVRSSLFPQSEDGLVGDDGMAARSYPEHWKGDHGLYCAGMVRRGIYGSCEDAELIAADISKLLHPKQEQGNGV